MYNSQSKKITYSIKAFIEYLISLHVQSFGYPANIQKRVLNTGLRSDLGLVLVGFSTSSAIQRFTEPNVEIGSLQRTNLYIVGQVECRTEPSYRMLLINTWGDTLLIHSRRFGGQGQSCGRVSANLTATIRTNTTFVCRWVIHLRHLIHSATYSELILVLVLHK